MSQNITAHRSTEWCSIDWGKNISTSKLTMKTGLKNIPFVFKKIRKLIFFSLITRRKKFRRPKFWNKIDRDPIVVFIQKSGKSDQ